MNRKYLLNSKFFDQCSSGAILPLQQLYSLDSTQCDECLVEAALKYHDQDDDISHSATLEKWRDLLSVVLILHTRGSLQSFSALMIKRWRYLRTFVLWPDFQLFTAYAAVISVLLGRPCEELCVEQLPDGACPLEFSGFSGFGEGPHPIFHAELGYLLFLYAEKTDSTPHLEMAIRLAGWQKNTLDYSCVPFSGFLSREGESSEASLLMHNYLLFSAAARATQDREMACIAHRFLRNIEEVESLDVPTYVRVLADTFSVDAEDEDRESFTLPGKILDTTLAIVGCRSPEVSAVATLFGGGSGMGALHAGDVKIVSFGPQHLPLNDCRGFSLEGGSRLLVDHVKEIDATDHEFALAGAMRVVSSVHKSGALASEPSGIWVDGRQKFRRGELTIETTFRRGKDSPALAFSFFVRCCLCKTEDGRVIKPRSLNRFLGGSTALKLEGTLTSIELTSEQKHEEMHVIPLSGGNNFWGADFLVAYILPPGQNNFVFKVNTLT